MSLPDVRREGPVLVGRDHGRIWRSGLRHTWERLVCTVRGHDWGAWQIDDYEGPGEELDGGGFMPYLSRDSEPGEYGLRTCRRRCGTSEQRWPEAEAPRLWREAVS